MKMLEKLSRQQVEQALAWLASPLPEPPPQGLEELHQLDWMVLKRLLEQLLEEKEHSVLQ
jgi:hypothetical protein